MAKRKKNSKSCPAGKKLVKIKGRGSFCARTGKKKGGSRKKTGVAKMSTAARKAMMKKACGKMSGAKKAKMKGLCAWARS